MSVLVLGAGGQLGQEFLRYPLTAYSRPEADLEDVHAIRKLFERHRPQVLINCAAFTNVDLAETNPERAKSVNSLGCRRLASLCALFGTSLIHFSTDYVFSGTQAQPYREEDETRPLNVYGSSKLEGEQAIAETWDNHVILRISWLFGRHGRNFAKTVLCLAHEQEELRFVNDQIGCPCSAANVAAAAWTIACQLQAGAEHFGIFHYSDYPVTSWHGFAQTLVLEARRLGSPIRTKTIRAIRTTDFPTPARRPANSVLDSRKLASQWGIVGRCWVDRLAEVICQA